MPADTRAVDHAEERAETLRVEEAAQPCWSPEELAAMTSFRGSGRVLCVRAATKHDGVERCLHQAGYRVGRLPLTRESSNLPIAAASFMPNLVFVALEEPTSACLDALENLSIDPRTAEIPLVALVAQDLPPAVFEEAYARSGCDFLRLGGSHVELLARTHLLVRLSTRALGFSNFEGDPNTPDAANSPVGTRLDLRDEATGAYSGTYFRHRLQQEIARAHRYQRPLTLVAVRCEAATDDKVAARVAEILGYASRNVDLVARLETDLFALMLPETNSEPGQALSARVHKDLIAEGWEAGVGVAGLGEPGDDGAYLGPDLLRLACARADHP